MPFAVTVPGSLVPAQIERATYEPTRLQPSQGSILYISVNISQIGGLIIERIGEEMQCSTMRLLYA
jgi:hypothetical protein